MSVCPIKNKHWNELVAKHGLQQAYVINRLDGIPSSSKLDGDSPIYQAIYNKVAVDPEYYAHKYSAYLNNKLPDGPTPAGLTDAFYARVSRYEGVEVIGDALVGPDVIPLFPFTEVEYKQAVKVPKHFNKVLEDLKSRFGVDYTVIDDPEVEWRGKYVNVGGEKHVLVNVAHAKLDTLFHEYYHPFVRSIKVNQPELYESLLTQAGVTTEEQLVQHLGEVAASKYPTSIVSRFLAGVSKLLRVLSGQKIELTKESTIEQVISYLTTQNVDVTAENTLMTAYQAAKLYAGAEKIEREAFVQDVIAILKEQAKAIKTNDESKFYANLFGEDVAKRATIFVGDKEEGEFSTYLKDKPSTYSVHEVKKIYAENRIPQTDTISYQGKVFTFDELVAKKEEENSVNRLYGKAGHAYFQYLTERDPILKAEAKANMEKYAEQMIQAGKNISSLGVVESTYDKLLELIGIDSQDRVSSELAMLSDFITTKDGWKIGTTADGVVQHPNGEITLFDLKFGNITSDMYTTRLMEYGKAMGMKDSKLSRAYLELTIRAIMIKEKFPDAKFRAIKLIKVDSKGEHQAYELDIAAYLELLSNYYSKTNPKLHAQLMEKDLFAANNYMGQSATLAQYTKTLAGMSLATQLEYVENKLKDLTLYSNSRASDTTYIKQERATLSQLYQELSKSPEANLKRDTNDISGLLGQLKNFSDIDHPQVQQLHTELQGVKKKMMEEYHEISKKEQSLFKEILYEAAPDEKTRTWVKKVLQGALAGAIVAAGFGATPFLIGVPLAIQLYMYRTNQRPQDLFAFMWRKDGGVSTGHYLNMLDTYLDKNGNEVPLTQAQKDYREFVTTTMREKYKSLMQTKAYETLDAKVYTYAEALEMPEELPIDFLPRVPKTTDELRLEQKFTDGFFGVETRFKDFVRDHFTKFFESNFEKIKQSGGKIPVRYFQHAGAPVVETGNHSFNVSQAFNMFLGNMLNKEYYDPLYALAVAVRDSVELSKDERGQQKYPNLTKWLDNEIMLQVLRDVPRDTASSKEIKFTVGKYGAGILGMPEGTVLVMNQHRALSALKSSVSFAVMSFKLVGATFNGVLITMTNATNASKAAIASIMGIPPDQVRATAASTFQAYADYKDYLAGEMTGKGSKLAKLAENMDWIPDSYDYAYKPGSLMYDISSPGMFNHAFMFHNAGENWGAMVHLAMMLRSTTLENDKGEKFTAWDAYDKDGKWTKGVRGYKAVGDYKIKLEELDEREIKDLKRQYEKLHGSYRYEEKVAIEASILGQFLLQFKKFFFMYMKNLFASPYKDTTVGRYVLRNDPRKPDGMSTFQWESEMTQGRLRVLMAATLGTQKWTEVFGSKEGRTKEQETARLRMAELMNTVLWVVGLMFLFANLFDDDEKDSYAYKRMMKLRDDMSQGLSPTDFATSLQQPFAAADKTAKTMKAFFQFITFEKTKRGTIKGASELSRSIPLLGNPKQIADIISGSSSTQEYLFGIIPYNSTQTYR